jgi:hypothetical protein
VLLEQARHQRVALGLRHLLDHESVVPAETIEPGLPPRLGVPDGESRSRVGLFACMIALSRAALVMLAENVG